MSTSTTPPGAQRALDYADRLYALLFGDWKPKRASRMTGRSEQNHKYIDIAEYSFTPKQFCDHLAGRETYAATLGLLGEARSGCKDYDAADEAEILAALDAAAAKGLSAAAIIMPDNRAHLWMFYDRPYPECDIRAQLRTIPRTGKGEDYPSGNPIRVPFGYHKVKRTRGVLVFQDRRRFYLDTSAGLTAGIAALLSLALNGKPEPAAIGDARSGGAAWGDAYKAEHWENLPDGGPLWHSPYIAAAAERRSDLAKLLRGERVTLIKKDDTRDDSDSAQVAALAFALLSADVCESQARAIADYLKPQLRPGRTLKHYRAHFDAELARYRPAHYKPQMIRYLGDASQEQPAPLPEAQHKPPPKSRARKDRPQKVAGALGYLEWLRTQVDPQSGSVMLSQAQCAARLGCNVRTIKRYEQQLRGQIERRVFARRQAGCLFILAPDVVPTSPADVVIADAEIAQQHAENADAAPMQEEHPAPLVPSPVPDSAPPPTLREVVAEAIECYGTRYNPSMGQAKPVERVKQYIAANYPDCWPDVAIECAYPQVLAARRYARQDAKEAEKARALKWPALVKKSQALAGRAAQLHKQGDKRAAVWERLAGIYAAEESRREAEGCAPSERLKPKRKPKGYTVAECEEWLMTEGRQTGACSPQTTPETPPRPLTARQRCERVRQYTQTEASRAAVDRLASADSGEAMRASLFTALRALQPTGGP